MNFCRICNNPTGSAAFALRFICGDCRRSLARRSIPDRSDFIDLTLARRRLVELLVDIVVVFSSPS